MKATSLVIICLLFVSCSQEEKSKERTSLFDTLENKSSRMVIEYSDGHGFIKKIKVLEKEKNSQFSRDPSSVIEFNEKMEVISYKTFSKKDSIIRSCLFSNEKMPYVLQQKIRLDKEYYLNQEIYFDTINPYYNAIDPNRSKLFCFDNLPDTLIRGKSYKIKISAIGRGDNYVKVYLINKNSAFEDILHDSTLTKYTLKRTNIEFPISATTNENSYCLKGAVGLVDTVGLPKGIQALNLIYFKRSIPVIDR